MRTAPTPVGYISYSADGRVCAIVVRADRLAPKTLPPTDVDKLRLFDSMLGYAGTYTLDNEKVVHKFGQKLTRHDNRDLRSGHIGLSAFDPKRTFSTALAQGNTGRESAECSVICGILGGREL
jgi:hypothetical protein